MSLRTTNQGLRPPRVTTPHGPGGVKLLDTRSGAGSERIGQPRRRAFARENPGPQQTGRPGRLIAATLIAALCGGCGQDKSGATHVLELAGQWTGKERGGQGELRLRLRGDGTFEWHQRQARGGKDAWSREGQWKPVSLLEEDGGGFTYYLEVSVTAGERDTATVGPLPGTYDVRMSPHPGTRGWMLRSPWGEFAVERETEPEEPAGRGREVETRDG